MFISLLAIPVLIVLSYSTIGPSRVPFRGGRGNKRSRNSAGNNDRRDAKDIPSKGSARVSAVAVIIHFLPCDKPSRPAAARASLAETVRNDRFHELLVIKADEGRGRRTTFTRARYIGHPLHMQHTRRGTFARWFSRAGRETPPRARDNLAAIHSSTSLAFVY